ncbi:32795_t:CDS:1, partial [Racocetra persica]
DWYIRDDLPRLRYKHDEALTICDIPCIWTVKNLDDLTPKELKNADALFCVNQPKLPKKKAWKGQKFIQYTLEPKTHCPQCHDKNHLFDFRATHDESSDVPTSYVRMDSTRWRLVPPFDVKKLSQNSPFISFIASHWTEFRENFVSSIEAHIPVASFGGVRHNTDWNIHPECEGLSHFDSKNCIISKYPFYFSIEN